MSSALPSNIAGPQTPNGRSYDDRVKEITDVSARLFAERGFNAVGVADICREFGIGKAGLYKAISSKQSLLESIYNVCMDDVFDHAQRVAADERPPEDKLRELGDFMINLIVTKPDHVRVFIHEYSSLRGEHRRRCRTRRRAYESIVEEVIKHAMDEGVLRAGDPRLVARAWFGLYIHTYTWLRPGAHDPATVSRLLGDVFLHGAGGPPPPGRRRPAVGRRRTA